MFEKIMSPFKKLGFWFRSKKYMIDYNSELSRLLNNKLEISVDVLKELDQHKFYFCCVKDATLEDVDTLQDYYRLAKKSLNWTPPFILFVNKELKFSDDQEVSELIKKYKESVKSGKIRV